MRWQDFLQVAVPPGIPTFCKLANMLLPGLAEHWVVFFAPSSTDFALPYLHERFELRREAASVSGSRKAAHIAAIGPMSSEHILRERHLHVDAVASKPSPAQLVEAIRAAAATT